MFMIFPRKEFPDESLNSTLVGTPQKEKGRVGGKQRQISSQRGRGDKKYVISPAEVTKISYIDVLPKMI